MAGATAAVPSLVLGQAPKRKRVAFLGTEVRTHSHAQHFLDRLSLGYGWRGAWQEPRLDIASVYIDQFPEGDLARSRVKRYGQTLYPSIEAALTLGASGWRTFFTVTLPNIRWALLYGVLLCNARAMGEFGAVAVVSGKIRGETATMPTMVEMFYNEYLSVAAFSLAAVLAMLALLTLLLKSLLEWRHADLLAATRRH